MRILLSITNHINTSTKQILCASKYISWIKINKRIQFIWNTSFVHPYTRLQLVGADRKSATVTCSRGSSHPTHATPLPRKHTIAPDEPSTFNVHFDSSAVCSHQVPTAMHFTWKVKITQGEEVFVLLPLINFIFVHYSVVGYWPVKIFVAFAYWKICTRKAQ